MTEHCDTKLYLYQRAEAELRMAQKAQKAQVPEAARAHQQLAALYFDRFYYRRFESSNAR